MPRIFDYNRSRRREQLANPIFHSPQSSSSRPDPTPLANYRTPSPAPPPLSQAYEEFLRLPDDNAHRILFRHRRRPLLHAQLRAARQIRTAYVGIATFVTDMQTQMELLLEQASMELEAAEQGILGALIASRITGDLLTNSPPHPRSPSPLPIRVIPRRLQFSNAPRIPVVESLDPSSSTSSSDDSYFTPIQATRPPIPDEAMTTAAARAASQLLQELEAQGFNPREA